MGAAVALVLTRWRLWLAFAAFGSAVAFCYRGDWLLASGIGALDLMRAAGRVRARLAETKTMMRMLSRTAR